jgi:hypothetical protein
MNETDLIARLIPEPQSLVLGQSYLPLRGVSLTVIVPAGPEHEACRTVLFDALRSIGATVRVSTIRREQGYQFTIGDDGDPPPLPVGVSSPEAYTMAVSPGGVAAKAASPAGLLYAAETLRQLTRVCAEEGRLPAMTITDYPAFKIRGIYIEGGQERFGRIVEKDYLREQIRRLAEFKMNTLVIECYNLFPYASFSACADSGTLSREDCREIIAEAKRCHVTIIPSLQTLAQASELVWNCEEGKPYREATAPGLICPSNPDLYPFIKGLYRDLLTLFDTTPLLGIGCSEIEMQWQARYCPRCRARIEKGETIRDLLLGHAERCIRAVEELSQQMGRPVRPLMWGDEFYMYGPGRDWVGLSRISKSTVMGFWKYWPDYTGIGGLMERGYDVLGISAMYNHCFYLADLSPDDPPKSWPAMEQTGIRNIDGMVRDAEVARRAHPGRDFLGVATASFSKHRLRAFDSIWYGFALNGRCTWRGAVRSLKQYQDDFTRAFARHYYDARTDEAAETLASAYEQLDRLKSRLERANQTLHDVVGVYDTQEAGYAGNSLMGAWQRCAGLIRPDGTLPEALQVILEAARKTVREAETVIGTLDAQRAQVGRKAELTDLRLAAVKIGSQSERQILMIEAQQTMARASSMPRLDARRLLAAEAKRWRTHRAEVAVILRRLSPLYTQDDPCGFRSLLRDVTAISKHLDRLARSGPEEPAAETGDLLLDEPFTTLDPAHWETLGQPQVVASRLETRASGGWGKFSGLLSRETFRLEERQPLVVEFELTPVKMGMDSQLLASAAQPTDISFRFAFVGAGNRFAVHTQSSIRLNEEWIDNSAGWRQRAASMEVQTGTTYRIRAEVTRRSWRVIVRRQGQEPWEMPFWDSGGVPMDDLPETKLMFADIEPENSVGASRWGPIRIWRAQRSSP